MPVIRVTETDVFNRASYADMMVCPVNLLGSMGAGISAAFRQRHPIVFEKYQQKCQDGTLKIGSLQVIKDPNADYKVINWVTKRHYADPNTKQELLVGLEALKTYLSKPENKYQVLVLPILSSAPGKAGYDEMEPEFIDYLDDLDTITILCLNQDILGYQPKYLVIVGPRAWANKEKLSEIDYQDQRRFIVEGVQEALKLWQLKPQDFDSFMSGGATGVDTVACGKYKDKASYELSLAHQYSKNKPIVIPADWDRYGNAAGFMRNRLLKEFGTHFVVIRPPGVASVGTTMMAKLIQAHNAKHPIGDPAYKPIYIHGDEVLKLRKIPILP